MFSVAQTGPKSSKLPTSFCVTWHFHFVNSKKYLSSLKTCHLRSPKFEDLSNDVQKSYQGEKIVRNPKITLVLPSEVDLTSKSVDCLVLTASLRVLK